NYPTCAGVILSAHCGLIEPTSYARHTPLPNKDPAMTTSDTDAVVVAAARAARQAGEDRPIRPFTFNAPQAELDELRRRIVATRLPEKATVAHQSQGVPLATVQKDARYLHTEYVWRKVESK